MNFNFRYILVALITVLMIGCDGSGSKEIGFSLIPFKNQDMKWGFIDTEANIKIPAQFDFEPAYFRDGYSLVRTDKQFFDYINEKGEFAGKKYKFATEFSEGLACVAELNGPPAYINTKLEVEVELKEAQQAGMFSEGLARFLSKDNLWGFIDKSGNIAIEPQFHMAQSFSDGYALVVISKENGGLTKGFIDKSGKIIKLFEGTNNTIRKFSDGLAEYTEGYGWGFIDTKGEITIKPNKEWTASSSFKNGYALILTKGFWGAIDKNGKMVVEPKYKHLWPFYSDYAAFYDGEKYGFLNKQGEVVIQPQYVDMVMPYFSDFAIVKKDSAYFLMDKQGNQIGTNQFMAISRNNMLDNVDQVVVSDYFDLEGLCSKMIQNVKDGEINGITPDMTSADIIKLFGEKESKIINMSQDSSQIVSKRVEFDDFSITSNVRYKRINGKWMLDMVNYNLKIPNKYYGKIKDLMEYIVKKFTDAGFDSNLDRVYYIESSKSRAELAQRGLRIELQFFFKH